MKNTQEKNGNLDEDWEESVRREKEWDNSYEGIYYNLCLHPNCPDELIVTIVRVVQKLPEDIKEFVYENCEFVSMSGLYGCCIDINKNLPWLIMLQNEVTEFTVAHEIAHAKLNHTRAVVTAGPTWKESEEAADNLAKKWGFTETLESEVKP